MDNLVQRARDYAVHAHARINHLRKYSLQPYDVHLKAVAEQVATVTDDQAMIAAAWLHDTVEDTPATFEDLECEFGSDVMQLVKELTDVSRPGDGNRALRKAIDRQHSAEASPRAKTVKLADIIDNCEDICSHDPKFGCVYLVEMKALLLVLQEGNRILYNRAEQLIADSEGRLGLPDSDQVVDDYHLPSALRQPLIAERHSIHLFTEAFTARDIHEPLRSVDRVSIPQIMAAPASWWDTDAVIGIREHGLATGYATIGALSVDGDAAVRVIDTRQIADMDASLMDVIHILTHYTYCFMALDGAVVGVISRANLEKPVARMWLFGILILIEVLVVQLIRSRWPDNTWQASLSTGRLDKSQQLQAERMRRGTSSDLLDCLQFSDKLQLAFLYTELKDELGFSSAKAAKKVIKDLESLRNNLAHGQDVTVHDWPQIVRLARRIKQM